MEITRAYKTIQRKYKEGEEEDSFVPLRGAHLAQEVQVQQGRWASDGSVGTENEMLKRGKVLPLLTKKHKLQNKNCKQT